MKPVKLLIASFLTAVMMSSVGIAQTVEPVPVIGADGAAAGVVQSGAINSLATVVALGGLAVAATTLSVVGSTAVIAGISAQQGSTSTTSSTN